MTEHHRTEAACLLEQGALLPPADRPQTAWDRGRSDFRRVQARGIFPLFWRCADFHFDLEGRWQRAFLENIHYLKGLDATIHAIDRVREGPNLVLKRRTLRRPRPPTSTPRVRSTALELIAGLDAGSLGRIESTSPQAQPLGSDDLRAFLERIGSWDSAAWLAHRERYVRTYGPLPFLPPECQNAVVLQATLGHATGVGFAGARRRTGHRHARSPSLTATHTTWPRSGAGGSCKAITCSWREATCFINPSRRSRPVTNAIGQTFPIEPRTREAPRIAPDDQTSLVSTASTRSWTISPVRPDRDGWRDLAARGLIADQPRGRIGRPGGARRFITRTGPKKS